MLVLWKAHVLLYFRVGVTNFIQLVSPQPVDCYELRLKGLSDRTTLVLSNTRELDRVPKTK